MKQRVLSRSRARDARRVGLCTRGCEDSYGPLKEASSGDFRASPTPAKAHDFPLSPGPTRPRSGKRAPNGSISGPGGA
eukprot:scaffold4805_cov229-Prasinococcus_capsulatus_cf.AAC.1